MADNNLGPARPQGVQGGVVRPPRPEGMPAPAGPANIATEAKPAPNARATIQAYVDLTRLVERLHRRFLDVLRAQLQRLGVNDINAVQCLMLSNIGEQEVNARHLMDRGYYLGSNASYNIKRLVENGYIEQRQADYDRRLTLLRVSAKGKALCAKAAMADATFANLLPAADLTHCIGVLRKIERVWDDFIVRPR
jgi:DNA-binding MarR family transcriptional regulator